MASPVYHPLRLALAPNLPAADMPLPDGSCSSSASTPEPDTAAAASAAHPPKRKGGRKPIYATSEERKQRNRQAQAAFRERRSEYIKQLEATIQRHEDALRALQQNHRAAADECLMLRYKNSLLERLLLEKGIDVHAELRLKTTATATADALPAAQRPHHKSAFARPPPSAHPGGFSAPAAALTPVSMSSPDSNPTPRPPSNSSASGPARGQAPYFMVPFPRHYDPLEPEYDHSHADCPPSSSSHHPTTTTTNTAPFALPRPNTHHNHSNNNNNTPPHPDILAQLGGDDGLGSLSAFVDHFDPMLDADPFGLSASMHFHTPLTYTQSNIR
ncbi:hypothetical protein LOZ58_000317 [Ophidiomyces ophidiicola]|nr:hypothetical protein LOZ58_000317 [Ophidiomyces ophidiicola]